MPKLIDLTGQRFGRLTVVKRIISQTYKRGLYECLCECGNTTIVKAYMLRSGKTRSCGCLHSEISAVVCGNNFRKHGMTHQLTWNSWRSMLQRCTQATHPDYKVYSQFKPCQFLSESVMNLVSLIGLRVSKSVTIDRINTLDGYHCGQCPDCKQNNWSLNVRWATTQMQNENKKSNRFIEINGVKKLAYQWANILGISEWKVRNKFLHKDNNANESNPG